MSPRAIRWLIPVLLIKAGWAASFTPSSGIAWTHNYAYTKGGFAVGLETTPSGPDPGQGGATAVLTQNIPFGITGLEILNGTFTMQGNRKAAALLRVAVVGDASQGNGGLVQGGVLILNMVLNVSNENPATVIIPHLKFDNIQQFIPVPSNGGPYQIVVSIQMAGAEWPMDAELEFSGRWF